MLPPTELQIETLGAFCDSARLLNSTAALSRRQAAMVAIVLNRFDWLWDMDFTIASAITHIGADGLALVCAVEIRYYPN